MSRSAVFSVGDTVQLFYYNALGDLLGMKSYHTVIPSRPPSQGNHWIEIPQRQDGRIETSYGGSQAAMT